MFRLNNSQIYAHSENCWLFIVSKITQTKRLGRSDSIYLSIYLLILGRSLLTQVVPKRHLHHHCAGNCLARYQLYPARLFGACISRSAKQNRSNIASKTKRLPSVHVLGDFNFKDIDWPDRLNKSGSALSQSEL